MKNYQTRGTGLIQIVELLFAEQLKLSIKDGQPVQIVLNSNEDFENDAILGLMFRIKESQYLTVGKILAQVSEDLKKARNRRYNQMREFLKAPLHVLPGMVLNVSLSDLYMACDGGIVTIDFAGMLIELGYAKSNFYGSMSNDDDLIPLRVVDFKVIQVGQLGYHNFTLVLSPILDP